MQVDWNGMQKGERRAFAGIGKLGECDRTHWEKLEPDANEFAPLELELYQAYKSRGHRRFLGHIYRRVILLNEHFWNWE